MTLAAREGEERGTAGDTCKFKRDELLEDPKITIV